VAVRLLITVATLFAAGALLLTAVHLRRRPTPGEIRADWIKYAVFAGITGVICLIACVGRLPLAGVLAIIAVIGARELSLHLNIKPSRHTVVMLGSTLLIGACLGHLLISRAALWPQPFLFVFLLVAVADAYSQLWGRLLGRHKLCPRLSPNKTVEGLLGGVLSATVAAGLLAFLMPGQEVHILAALGAIVALAAVAGDLTFSFIKRRLNIKDFSELLPGHGGLLDRFDSLVVAAPVFYWTSIIMLK